MTDKNETTIVNALHVAAAQYAEDAKGCPPEAHRLREQFERQAAEAAELADKIEQSGLDQAAYL